MLNEELFDLFFDLFGPLRGHFAASAAAVGVSPVQAKVLRLLGIPRPMRDLAAALECDASYITSIVDQLESMELVQRQPDPGDRRVKQIRITRQGRGTRQRFEALLFGDLPGARDVPEAELLRLRDGLRRLRDGIRAVAPD